MGRTPKQNKLTPNTETFEDIHHSGFALFSLDKQPGRVEKKKKRKEKKKGARKQRKKAGKKDPAIRWFSLCVLWETTRKKIRTDLFLSTASEESRDSPARNSSGRPASAGLCCMIVFEG